MEVQEMSDEQDWRSTDRQRNMISDRVSKMSKREASLLIRLIEAIFANRISELEKQYAEIKGEQT